MHKQLTMPHNKGRESAFTIVELLIVIVVIGILATVVVVAYNGISGRAVTASLQSDLAGAKKQLENFKTLSSTSTYPTANNCTNTLSTEVCLKASDSNTFTYTPNTMSSPTSYSLVASRGTTSYQVVSSSPCGSTTLPNIVTSGLVLNLDAGNPNSYAGSGTTWTDLSGSGNNGTLVNGPTYSCANGGSVSLDGIDDYVLAGRIPYTGTSTSSVSWSIWVNPLQSTDGNIMSMSSTNPQSSWNMPPITATGQKFRARIWSNGFLYSSTYSLNSWYYLVLVFDYSLGAQKLYVNGVLQASTTGAVYNSSGVDNYIFLGQRNPGSDSTGMFGGRISNFQIYSKALSDTEINQNFNAIRSRFGI